MKINEKPLLYCLGHEVWREINKDITPPTINTVTLYVHAPLWTKFSNPYRIIEMWPEDLNDV
jgi:uncharacterized membrane protein